MENDDLPATERLLVDAKNDDLPAAEGLLVNSINDDLPAAERLLILARRFNAGKRAMIPHSRGATVDQQKRRTISLCNKTPALCVFESLHSIVAPRLAE